MNDRETARYDMFGRVVVFGTDNAADFAAGSVATLGFAKLKNNIIPGLDTAKAQQKPEGATAKSVLLDGLRLDVQNITRTARAISQTEAGFAQKFRAPGSASDHDLLTATDAILAQLVPVPTDTPAQTAAKAANVAKFVARELPASFATDLGNDRKAVDTAAEGQEDEREEGVSSTSAVGRLIRDGMAEVNTLDAICHNKYTRDADKLRAWKSASHIERAPKKKKPGTPTPPPG